jgi:hypothetical protein
MRELRGARRIPARGFNLPCCRRRFGSLSAELAASRIEGRYVPACFTPPGYQSLIRSGTAIGTFAVQRRRST